MLVGELKFAGSVTRSPNFPEISEVLRTRVDQLFERKLSDRELKGRVEFYEYLSPTRLSNWTILRINHIQGENEAFLFSNIKKSNKRHLYDPDLLTNEETNER